eukprot:9142644-Heterocapsa_arctica.AAC.1
MEYASQEAPNRFDHDIRLLPTYHYARKRSLWAESGREAAQRRPVGTALRPVAGVHASSKVACES